MLSCVFYKVFSLNSRPGDIEFYYSAKYVYFLIEANFLPMQPAQFVIALDIIEDFLVGEGFQYLRLVSETRTWPFILRLPVTRTETRNNRKDRRAWMSSIVRGPMFSSIFSPRELAVLESTCGAQIRSSSSILISIPIRYALVFPRMLHVYSSLLGPSSMNLLRLFYLSILITSRQSLEPTATVKRNRA